MATYQDFKNAVLGTGHDVDGYYGNQCWDGYAYYCKWLGVPYANCTVTGYVRDIWEQRATNGILNYFDEVSTMQPGDVAVFRVVSGWTPYSHIAIFDSDIDGTYGYFLGQNQGGANGAFNLCKLPYSATYDTAFRPKVFSGGSSSSSSSSSFSTSDLIEEHAKATFTVDQLNARVNDPNGTVCRQYNTGDSVEYSYKWVGNGHRYICWYEATNLIMVAVSETEDYNSTRWATFSAIDEQKTDTKTDTNTDSNPTEETNGFSSVEEGQIEQSNLKDEVLENDFVTVDLIPKDLYSYKCPYVMTPKTIVIHNAGTPNGTASNLNKGLHNTNEYKSWHFSVDDKDVIESLPLNRNAFATGDGGFGIGNRTGIQIEIAKDMDTDTTAEWQKARKNGAKLTAILLKKYGWSIDNVSKHQDYKMTDGTYKYCPHKILDEGWDDFKKLIQSELDSLDKTTDDDNNSDNDVEKDDKNNVTNDTIKETNSLLKMLIDLLKKIFNIK